MRDLTLMTVNKQVNHIDILRIMLKKLQKTFTVDYKGFKL